MKDLPAESDARDLEDRALQAGLTMFSLQRTRVTLEAARRELDDATKALQAAGQRLADVGPTSTRSCGLGRHSRPVNELIERIDELERDELQTLQRLKQLGVSLPS